MTKSKFANLLSAVYFHHIFLFVTSQEDCGFRDFSPFTVSCHKVIHVVFMIQYFLKRALMLLYIFKECRDINSYSVVLSKTNK